MDAHDARIPIDAFKDHDGSPNSCQHPAVKKDCTNEWCKIPAGCFIMGSPPDEPCRGVKHQETQHQVTLTRGFEISAYETTRAQFLALMGYLPPPYTGSPVPPCTLPTCPVGTVTWHDAIRYCNALSIQKGLDLCYTCTKSGSRFRCTAAKKYAEKKIYSCPGYRLPTEAEWEYAYRAGTKTALYNGPLQHCFDLTANADKIAWYDKNSGMKTQPVGTKQPNRWGLYDMAGNAVEFCNDWFAYDLGSKPMIDPAGPSNSESTLPSAIVKGGMAIAFGTFLRAAEREYEYIEDAYDAIGFRCVRSK